MPRVELTDVLAKSAAQHVSQELKPGESEFIIHGSSAKDPKLKKFKQAILSWLHKYVPSEAASIHDVVIDLVDGQILAQFIRNNTPYSVVPSHLPILESLTGETIEIQPAMGDKAQKSNLSAITRFVEQKLHVQSQGRWSVEGMMQRDISSMYCFLVDLAHVLQCPYPLPSDFSLAIVHNEIVGGLKKTKTTLYQITKDETEFQINALEKMTSHGSMGLGSDANLAQGSQDLITQQQLAMRNDAFDKLFQNEAQSEANIQQVTELILSFVNDNLEPMEVKVTDLALQMHDGVYIIILVGALANFFVPLSRYNLNPQTVEEKLNNVVFAFKLLESLGIKNPKWNAVDVIRKDLKAILRILYDIIEAFKHLAE